MLNTAQNIYLIILWIVLSITCLELLNRIWAPTRRRVHNDVIGWQISILGTLYAVMVGFMLYAVWSNFQTAETNANNEANAAVNLYRTADGLPPAPRAAIEAAASNYVQTVYNTEWPTMNRAQVPHAAQVYIMQLWSLMTRTSAQTFTEQSCLQQAMHELSTLTEHRRVRVLESETEMPTILWTVLVVGGMITIASCCMIGTENRLLHYALIFALSLLISLSLVAIGDIDRPFQGSVHVSPRAFLRAHDTMVEPRPGR